MKRFGSALEHGEAHSREHRLWSRRDFLSASGLLGAGSMLLGGLPVRAFQPTPLLASLAANWDDNDRILVLIRLDGGNDGLNTVIKRGSSEYYNLRPTLGIPDNKLWALSAQYGMPQETNSLQSLWAEGMMKVIFNVGYPDPNYSHFRSSDIITSASDRNEVVETGWVGRFLEHEYAAFLEAPPSVPPALQIGVQTNLLFTAEEANMALAVSSPQEFYQIAQTGQLYETESLSASNRDRELAYVRQTANAAFRYAETIREAFNTGKNDVTFPTSNSLSAPMSIISRVIKGNMGTRIFLVDIGDFDTHVNQMNNHLSLLQQLSTAVRAFYDDLAFGNSGLEKKVLTMTFSEFGRTIYENGSRGTDHGAGTHTLLFGGGIGNGFVGQYQDLSNPDPVGDPVFSVDFRDVYASVLQNWLGNPPELVDFVLGKPHPTITGLVPATPPALGDNGKAALLGHNPHPSLSGTFEIKYSLTHGSALRLQILDKAGHVLRTLVSDFVPKGSHTFLFRPAQWYVPPGVYQYRLMANGQVFQREIRI
ncbi:MAG: DUF1501 domain-containing protein [Saprospiraceae bacterium]|jgi:uncharacterized protein (DUF1501 family)|nr:DUF1501 domain-containing protein [Saprospiraceae bacterium]